jgi:hypothetical protein
MTLISGDDLDPFVLATSDELKAHTRTRANAMQAARVKSARTAERNHIDGIPQDDAAKPGDRNVVSLGGIWGLLGMRDKGVQA